MKRTSEFSGDSGLKRTRTAVSDDDERARTEDRQPEAGIIDDITNTAQSADSIENRQVIAHSNEHSLQEQVDAISNRLESRLTNSDEEEAEPEQDLQLISPTLSTTMNATASVKQFRVYKSVFSIFNLISEGLNELDDTSNNGDSRINKEWVNKKINDIINRLFATNRISLYVDDRSNFSSISKMNLRKIVQKYYVFDSPFSRAAFRLHETGLYSRANGLLVEFTSKVQLRHGTANIKRGSFDLKKIDSKLSSWMSWEGLFREGTEKMRNNTLKPDAYFPYVYNRNCRGIFQTLIIHLTGILSMAQNRFESNYSMASPRQVNEVLLSVSPTYSNVRVNSFEYTINMKTMNSFRENIWMPVIDDVLSLAHELYSRWILTVPEEERTRYGRTPKSRLSSYEKWYVRKQDCSHLLDTQTLVNLIFDYEEETLDFWARSASHLFRIFLSRGYGLLSDFYEDRFELIYGSAVRQFYGHIFCAFLTTIEDNSEFISINEEERLQYISELRNRKEEWIDNVIRRVRNRPIQYIEQPEIDSIILHEQQNQRENIIPVVEPDDTIIPPINREAADNTNAEDRSIDIDATVHSYRERYENNGTTSTRRDDDDVMLLAVEEPPPGSLDAQGKCKCCRIDWNKINGRVQIIRCPPNTNISVVNNVIRRTLRRAQEAATNILNNREDSEHEDQSRRQVQLTFPAGQSGNRTVTLDTSIVNQLSSIPLNLIDGLRIPNRQMDEQDGSAVTRSIPDLVKYLFDRVLYVSSRLNSRRITAGAIEEQNQQLSPPDRQSGPSEVSMSLVEEQPSSTPDQDQPPRRIRLSVEKRNPVPIVTDESIQGILDELGHGEVNTNQSEAFSATNSLQTQPQVPANQTIPNNPYSGTSHTVYEDNVSRQDHVLLTVEGESTTDPRRYTMQFILIKWILECRFSHSLLISPELWSIHNIRCTGGPLYPYRPIQGSVYNAPRYNSIWEFIGSQLILSTFELYFDIYEICNRNEVWNLSKGINHATRYRGDKLINGVTNMEFTLREEDINFHAATKYSLVVAHIYLQTRSTGYRRQDIHLQPYKRRLGFINGREQHVEDGSQQAILNIISITDSQPSQEEYSNQQRVQSARHGESSATLYAHFDVVGYVGPLIKFSDYTPHIPTIPPTMINKLLNRETHNNSYTEVKPFTSNIEVTPDEMLEYITENCTNNSKLGYLRLLLHTTNLADSEHHQRYSETVTKQNLPPLPTASQITACLNVNNILEENINVSSVKQFNTETFTIIGPAGTGKTRTLMLSIATALNDSQLAPEILNIYEHIEYLKDGDRTCKPTNEIGILPEDKFRILIVTETNIALETIESELNKGLLFKDGDSTLRRAVPLYSKLVSRHVSNTTTRKPVTQIYDVPDEVSQRTNGCIVMTTFGSLSKAFSTPLWSTVRRDQGRPQYDLIVIDEAAQVGMRSYSCLLCQSCLHVSRNRTPTFLLAGDKNQLPPISTGRNSAYKDLASHSVLHLMVQTDSGNNYITCRSPWILLDVQFRMHPLISELSNTVANRRVRTHPSVLSRIPQHITEPNTGMLFDNLEPSRPGVDVLDPSVFNLPILWFNPYKSHIPITSSRRPHVLLPNTSFLEATTVISLVQMLVLTRLYTPHQILILTPYNTQANLIHQLLRDRYHSILDNHRERGISHDIPEFMHVNISTVGSIQGGEQNCIIFSTVRRAGEKSLGIAGLMSTVYVAITRAQYQLFFVGNYDHLVVHDIWRDISIFFDRYNVVAEGEGEF